jgi:hypothetical protein
MATGFQITPPIGEKTRSAPPQQGDNQLNETVAELNRRLERQSQESTRRINELQQQNNIILQSFQQAQQPAQQAPPQQQQAPKQMTQEDAWNAFWNGGTAPAQNQTTQGQQTPPTPQATVDPVQMIQQVAQQTIQKMNQDHISLTQAEKNLATRFANEYPDLAATHGSEITALYNRYKGLHPQMSMDDRYALLAEDAKALWGEESRRRQMTLAGGGQMRPGGGNGKQKPKDGEVISGWIDADKISHGDREKDAENYRAQRNRNLAVKRGDEDWDG